MRLLFDACMWGGAVQALRAAGHDVVWVDEWERDPGDAAILSACADERRVLVTLDKDFGELAIKHRLPHSGIIRIVEDSVWEHAALCQRALDECGADLSLGAIVVVELGRIRSRLPDADA
ncbi:MAG TPA: DUF5615 family PIN-like protein [Thermoanaerobaculia bacterium]|nr:DUF5615 family PIN-like protein [Thermoanaerobaculia bacterium]